MGGACLKCKQARECRDCEHEEVELCKISSIRVSEECYDCNVASICYDCNKKIVDCGRAKTCKKCLIDFKKERKKEEEKKLKAEKLVDFNNQLVNSRSYLKDCFKKLISINDEFACLVKNVNNDVVADIQKRQNDILKNITIAYNRIEELETSVANLTAKKKRGVKNVKC